MTGASTYRTEFMAIISNHAQNVADALGQLVEPLQKIEGELPAKVKLAQVRSLLSRGCAAFFGEKVAVLSLRVLGGLSDPKRARGGYEQDHGGKWREVG